MPAAIVLTGLSMNDPVPGLYAEVLFAQGPSAGFGGQRPMLLIGNKTSSGSATTNTEIYGPDSTVPLQNEQDAINLFGPGSELHRMWRRAARVVGATIPIYAIAVTASVGAAATRVHTLASVPNAAGSIRFWVAEEFVDVAFASGDTLSTITAAAVAAINSKTHWPVVASQTNASTSNDSVTLTAKVAGPRGNWLRSQALIMWGGGATGNTTITNTSDGFFTSGATADSNTTALGTISPSKFYYIVSAAEDATQFGALVTQVNSQALPTTGIRQRCFAGSVDSQGNVNTIAVGVNAARAEIVWMKNGVVPPCEMAAHCAAVYAFEELAQKPRFNFSGYPFDDSSAGVWGAFPAPRDKTAWPTRANLSSALLNGVTPIAVYPTGSRTYLVKRITTKSLNGAVADYRIRDAHKVTVCDFFTDDLLAREAAQMSGKDLVDDVKQGQPQPPPTATSANRLRELVVQLLNEYFQSRLLDKVDQTKASLVVQRETLNTNRLSASIPLYPPGICDQIANQVLQVA